MPNGKKGLEKEFNSNENYVEKALDDLKWEIEK